MENFEIIVAEELRKLNEKEALSIVKLILTEVQGQLEKAHDVLVNVGKQNLAEMMLNQRDGIKRIRRIVSREV